LKNSTENVTQKQSEKSQFSWITAEKKEKISKVLKFDMKKRKKAQLWITKMMKNCSSAKIKTVNL